MNLKRIPVIIPMMKKVYAILVVGLTISLALPRALADGLPDLGDVSATVLSPLQEQRIAEQIMRDVMSTNTADVVQDPEIQDYVSRLGQKLAAAGPDPLQKFNFFVVKDNSINAFAMPGGVIGVHTGLILAANEESQVAGVLGHEVGHVVQRHLARMLAQQKTDSIFNMAAMAAALLLARGSPQLAGGAMATATAGSIQRQLDYTREHEREADRVGMQILEKAGYDTRGMSSFFEILQKGSRFVDGSSPSFLRTHPLTTERIADVRSRESTANYKMIPYSPDFDYVRAKLLAGLGTASQAIEIFKGNLKDKKFANEAAQHYGLAVAYLRKNDANSAATELAWLRDNAENHPMFETLAANIQVTAKNADAAGKQFLRALTIYPSHRALIYGYAEHLLRLNQLDNILKFVEEKQQLYPDDPYLYELKSRVYTMQGKNLLRHQAQGEAYVRRYNLQRALEQMDLAAKAGDGDFYQQSIVEARLNQLRYLAIDPNKPNKSR